MAIFKCCAPGCDIVFADLPLWYIDGATLDPTPFDADTQAGCCWSAWTYIDEFLTDGTRVDGGEVNIGAVYTGYDHERFIGHYRHVGYEITIERIESVCDATTYNYYYVELYLFYEYGVGIVGYNGTFNIDTATNWYCTGILDPYCVAKPDPLDNTDHANWGDANEFFYIKFSKLFAALPTGVVTFDECVDVSGCSPMHLCAHACPDNPACYTYDIGEICFDGPASVDVEFSGP